MLARASKHGFILLLVLSFAVTPVVALAQAPTGFPNPLGTRTLEEVLQSVAIFLLGLIGLLALAGLVYGGIQIITSFGDGGKVERGKHIVFWAVIGLAVALGAVVIIEIVANILTGSP